MTKTADDVIETIWVTDAELIRRSGVPERIMRKNLQTFDETPAMGFPAKDKLWGGRRHWPSVLEYWKRQAERKMSLPPLRRAS